MRPFQAASDPLISVDQALAQVLAAVWPLGGETVPLADALGRVLREDITAPADVPPADNSAMDGYAVRAADTTRAPVRLRVIDDLPAGKAPAVRLEEQTAIRIMTGAAMPDGADAVAEVEITDMGAQTVTIERVVAPGANIRRRGDDIRAGDLILRAGTVVGAGEIGVAAAAQRASLTVSRRPTVAILSTGDELAELGTLSRGATTDTNSYVLAALAAEAGATPRRLPIARDTREATTAALQTAGDCDMVITTGGVSVGAYDFVKEALESVGAHTRFWRVAMKPGKPVVFATRGERLFFGLPGNPVSAMVSFLLFVGPAIRKSLGRTSDITAPVIRMRTTAKLKGAGDRRAYLRVRVIARDGELIAEPMRAQGSHISTSMAGANGLAIVEAGVNVIDAGQAVPVMLIGPVSGPSL